MKRWRRRGRECAALNTVPERTLLSLAPRHPGKELIAPSRPRERRACRRLSSRVSQSISPGDDLVNASGDPPASLGRSLRVRVVNDGLELTPLRRVGIDPPGVGSCYLSRSLASSSRRARVR